MATPKGNASGPNGNTSGTSSFGQIVKSFHSGEDRPFAEVLSAERMERVFRKHRCAFGQRGVYTAAVMLWSYLSQVLRDGKEAACRVAVARIISFSQLSGLSVPTADTGDYCRARAKLSAPAIRELSCEVAGELEASAEPAWLWKGREGRKKVTCFTKDNIMKLNDVLFRKIFDETAAEYPDIENEHWIVDIGAAKLADTPEAFDVVVIPNLYGGILSDRAAQIAGSVGLAGSANIGDGCAMFEAIHGSAPRRAGQNLANPSGLFLGAIQMLVHIGQADVAERAQNAWLKTIEDGVHTYDIFKEGVSKQKGRNEGICPSGCRPLASKTASS